MLHANYVSGAINSGCSARSKVRGYLQIYHAYLPDSQIPAANTEGVSSEESWEIVNEDERNTSSSSIVSRIKFMCYLLYHVLYSKFIYTSIDKKRQ